MRAVDPIRRRRLENIWAAFVVRGAERDFGERLMYRPSDPQKALFDAGGLLPPEKRQRCEKTWAGAFREHALPILRKVEDEFAGLYHATHGRPNRPVELVLGVLILKDMSNLTDREALEALEYDVRWWYALSREPHELHLCEKTLHNFRNGVIKNDKSKVAFRKVTDELIAALGVKVGRQRLDSKQILSNFAILTRLGLMCETIRVFLREVKKIDEKAYEGLPVGILKRHGEESCYQDARKTEGPRRLKVVARDVYRLIERFEKDKAIAKTEGWKLLKRLFEEQCKVTRKPRKPRKDDDDHGEAAVPVDLKEAKEVRSDSLQTPHDPEATYSGHKGKGYKVQVSETCVEGQEVRVITDVEVTRSCVDEARETVPAVERLEEAGQKPEELVADASYSGASNAAELSQKGVKLTAPCPAAGKPEEGQEDPEPEPKCPEDPKKAGEWLRRQEASEEFQKRYAIRAGIEATMSELSRGHGMNKLRVRGEARVKLSVYFKALACNLKRALRCWLERSRRAEAAACLG